MQLRGSPWRSPAARSRSRPAGWPSRPPAPSSSARATRWSSAQQLQAASRDVDFLPLTVDVEERMYAAGKIPGSFFKREGRPGEKGTLTARMIDRPIRPLFPKEWRYDTQLVAIPLSIDHVHPYDILAMNGASAALMISDIPLPTPVGAVRIGKVDGNFVVNPNEPDLLAPTPRTPLRPRPDRRRHRGGDPDGRGRRQRDPRGRDPRRARHRPRRDQEALRAAARPRRQSRQGEESLRDDRRRRGAARGDPRLARRRSSTRPRRSRTSSSARTPPRRSRRRSSSSYAPAAPEGASEDAARSPPRSGARPCSWPSTSSRSRSSASASPSTRSAPTGARENEIRDISIEVGVTPRTHGSALFTRGQTQALSVVAMGTLKEEMRLDTLGLETKKYYWHHYNFPPFSVGEAGRMGGVKRRDIGHGALAERALAPMVPSIEEFPYSIRVVSDILESNGSSSMASVCGSSLSLMDAGVPIKRPVAGIAMGLIKEGDDYIVLTDIAGVEDHLGDMDFKVAGTERGITALQMDIKITGVTFDILRDALAPGQRGAHVHPRQDGRGDRDAARAALAVRAAHPDDPDRPLADRPADRQGRRNDPRPRRRVRIADRRQRRRPGADLLGQRRARRRARRARAR